MKSGREHRVPLAGRTLELIGELPRQGDFLFPGSRADKPLSNMALLMALRRMGRDDITAHGFRSSFRDWVAERTNYPGELAEMALAHAIADKVEAAYRRGDLFEKRRRLMAEWARYCSTPGSGGDVVALAMANKRYEIRDSVTLEKSFATGKDPGAVLQMLMICCVTGDPYSEWAARAFRVAYLAGVCGELKSWDESL